MTFLNPLVLFGLAAAAIPILIHLLNLRKLKKVEFSSLRFLKEMQKTRMRRVRIKQWILLLLRTLMVIALVFAFARPALRGSLAGVIGTHARTTSVVLLDDSPSMAIRTDRGLMFARAREAAVRAAGLLQEGDEMYILRLSEVGHAENPAPARTREEAAALLGPAQVTAVTVPYREAFAVAARLLGESRNFNKELYLLSDLQKTQFAAAEPPDTADLFDDGVRVFLSAPVLPQQDNAGISDVTVTSRILSPGRPVVLQTLVRNPGSAPVQNGLLSVYLDGTRVLQQSVNIPPGGSVSPTLVVTPKRRGIIHGSVQIEDDALEADNRRSFVLDIPGSIRLLVVGSTESDTRLSSLAFTLGSDSSATAMNVRTITAAQLSSVDINRFDAVVVCGVPSFPPSEGARIVQFVKAGGGMLMFSGDSLDIAAYNERLFSPLGIPPLLPPVQHGKPSGDGGTAGSYLTFSSVDFAHPLFTGLFDEGVHQRTGGPPVESPQVFRSIPIRTGSRGQAIISLSDGTPFLAEFPAGAGRVLLMGVEAGMAWSDFPVKGLFVPLLHRSAAYLAARHDQVESYPAGRQPAWNLRIPDRSDRDMFFVRAPDNDEEKVVPRFNPVSGMASFTSGPAMVPGVYDLQRETPGKTTRETLAAVAVNPDPAESDLAQADEATLRSFETQVGLRADQILSLRGDERLEQAVHEARFGVELWKYLAGLAVLLALLEMAIGREGKNTMAGGQE
jgi:hypothetical protein